MPERFSTEIVSSPDMLRSMGEIISNSINFNVDVCHAASLRGGWWHDADGNHLAENPYMFVVKLGLIHSEVSEALEGDRKGKMDDHLPHREMREVELADAIIRIFDLAGAYDLDVGGALVDKLVYNMQREDHKVETRNADGGKKY